MNVKYLNTEEISLKFQELLQLFGVPYILAPFEAEAQCAKLLELGLVDGIITDDRYELFMYLVIPSDVFLFGGDSVYRHMFNKDEFVEFYRMSDIQKEVGLNRYLNEYALKY